jgi:hypothetical protein
MASAIPLLIIYLPLLRLEEKAFPVVVLLDSRHFVVGIPS